MQTDSIFLRKAHSFIKGVPGWYIAGDQAFKSVLENA